MAERRRTQGPNLVYRSWTTAGTVTLMPGEPRTLPDNKGGMLTLTMTPVPGDPSRGSMLMRASSPLILRLARLR